MSETLLDLGADVIDPGLVSTPTFYYAVYHYDYDCGMMITASHNPKNYNGMKIVSAMGKMVSGTDVLAAVNALTK